MDPSQFSSFTLRHLAQGERVQRILAAAIQAVEPGAAVRQHVQRQGHRLLIGELEYPLEQFEHVYLAALGKAALPMAQAMAEILGNRLSAGLVITKHMASYPSGWTAGAPEWTMLAGGHPVPDERSLAAGAALLDFFGRARAGDLVLCLVSGGGSALAVAPRPGISLADLQQLTSALLASGASIDEINTLRRHLDLIKGGGLARQAAPAHVVSLILSDVVGSRLETIASGPTAADPSTVQDALAVLDRYHLAQVDAPAVLETLQKRGLAAGQFACETPKPGDPLFARVQNLLIASNLQAAQAAVRQAQLEGFHSCLLRTDLTGEAREAAVELSALLRKAAEQGEPAPRPACLVAGGETTVTLTGAGLGGRNQELALAAVDRLANLPGVLLVTLATDGEDGPTDAAGALVDGQSYARALAAGLQPAAFLADNDAYHFFAALDDLLKPGPTGTNVNDLAFLFTF